MTSDTFGIGDYDEHKFVSLIGGRSHFVVKLSCFFCNTIAHASWCLIYQYLPRGKQNLDLAVNRTRSRTDKLRCLSTRVFMWRKTYQRNCLQVWDVSLAWLPFYHLFDWLATCFVVLNIVHGYLQPSCISNRTGRSLLSNEHKIYMFKDLRSVICFKSKSCVAMKIAVW